MDMRPDAEHSGDTGSKITPASLLAGLGNGFIAASQLSKPDEKRQCDSCGKHVDSKVAAYCRFNRVKLGGKTLCRDCQK